MSCMPKIIVLICINEKINNFIYQVSWSTLPKCPLKVFSLVNRSRSRENITTDLSNEPDASLRPSQLHPTV